MGGRMCGNGLFGYFAGARLGRSEDIGGAHGRVDHSRLASCGAGATPRSAARAAESPREGQCPTVPSGYEHPPRGACSMPRAIGRTIALLPSGGSVTACPANERTD
jgi:hypothetical protein